MARRQKTLEEQSDLRDKLPLHKRLVWLYAVLFGGVGGAILWAVDHWSNVGWLQSDGPNFGADFVGLAITLLLIDRLVSWRRDAELFPRRQGALRQVGRAVRDLEVFFIWSYKAASRESSPEPQSIVELFRAWASALPHLDLRAVSPDSGRDWGSFIAWRLGRIAAVLDRAVERHEEVIPVPLAAAIEAVLDDPTMLLLGNGEALTNAVKTAPDGHHLPVIDDLVTKLECLYREYAEFRRRPYALVTWSTAESRPWASARIESGSSD